MIGGKRVLGVIAARGGSKGLPRKNIVDFGGKPLIAWSIAAAAQSQLIDRAVVSTDDSEIAEVARAWLGDVPFLRPSELATDTAPIVDAVLHCIDALDAGYAYVVLLQATSPLRAAADIDGAIAACARAGAPACVAVTAVAKGPWWMFTLGAGSRLQPILEDERTDHRRQDLPEAFLPNGAVYVAEVDWLRRSRSFYGADTLAYVMPPERSVDIDSETDWLFAEALLRYQA